MNDEPRGEAGPPRESYRRRRGDGSGPPDQPRRELSEDQAGPPEDRPVRPRREDTSDAADGGRRSRAADRDDRGERGGRPPHEHGPPPDRRERFRHLDTNQDGVLSEQEYLDGALPPPHPPRPAKDEESTRRRPEN